MRKFLRFCPLVAGLAAMFVTAGCDKLRSRDQQNQGVHDFGSAKYSDAVEHFTKAVQLDPTNSTALSYLATAYYAQWIPGAESPENKEFASHAREEFKKVLDQNPKDTTALSYLGNMAYQEALPLPEDQKVVKFNEAADWFHKQLEVDPNNKQAYYYLGVIAYGKWHPQLALAELNAHMKSDDPGPIKDKKIKDQLQQDYGSIVEEGITDLKKAIDIDKDYADAMVYEQLLIREKAYLDSDRTEYDQDVAKADQLRDLSMETKKRNDAKAAEAANAGGIVQDTSK